MIPCPTCRAPLPPTVFGEVAGVTCVGCRRESTALRLPAEERSIDVRRMARLAAPGENTCYNCPQKAADTVCELCGSYTCPDCEVDWFGRRLCLTCLHAQRETQPDLHFRSQLTVHDNVALGLLLLPAIVVPVYGLFFSALVAPVSVFLVIRHWHKPRGIVPRGRFRQVSTLVLAVVFMLAALAMIVLATAAVNGVFDRGRPTAGAAVPSPTLAA